MIRILAVMSALFLSFSLFFIIHLTIADKNPVQTIQRVGTCVAISASPNYLSSDSEHDAIAAINNARQFEHVRALRLPSNYYQLNVMQQQFILVNLERTDRGLPAVTLDNNLSQMALAYSRQLHDLHFFAHTSPIGGTFAQRINSNPAIQGHYRLTGENLAGNPVAAGGAIYEYMYNDIHESCGHRQNILEATFRYIGIGTVTDSSYGSISTQEFLASAPWNPYHGAATTLVAPRATIQVNRISPNNFLLLQANTQVHVGNARVTWFLDHLADTGQVGSLWSIDLRLLHHGTHTVYAYVVDGMQSYTVASYRFQL